MQTPKKFSDLRCAVCNRLLARGTVSYLQIRCRSCKTINHFHGHEPISRAPESAGGSSSWKSARK
ncbi:MAG: Com family DNA-binding transcriptional regulator [Candidatus Accumulibacter sp.]|nr:Com family DNA-binding transcriptional regulator [Accumulibacter sp.]